MAARGTGHTLSGTFLPEGGITIDMRNMLESSFDNTTKIATLQARPSPHIHPLPGAVAPVHGWQSPTRSTCARAAREHALAAYQHGSHICTGGP